MIEPSKSESGALRAAEDSKGGKGRLILVVEDNPADVDLIRESLGDMTTHVTVDVAVDGEDAVNYLASEPGKRGSERPQLILLDLNLPRIDGRQVLAEIKTNSDLRAIPVVVLSSSAAEKDVIDSYELGANCYVTKPSDFESYREMVRAIEKFWLSTATLPPSDQGSGVERGGA